MIDRARPGLVTFYDIRPGNGAGLFLQPRNLHRAIIWIGKIQYYILHSLHVTNPVS